MYKFFNELVNKQCIPYLIYLSDRLSLRLYGKIISNSEYYLNNYKIIPLDYYNIDVNKSFEMSVFSKEETTLMYSIIYEIMNKNYTVHDLYVHCKLYPEFYKNMHYVNNVNHSIKINLLDMFIESDANSLSVFFQSEQQLKTSKDKYLQSIKSKNNEKK